MKTMHPPLRVLSAGVGLFLLIQQPLLGSEWRSIGSLEDVPNADVPAHLDLLTLSIEENRSNLRFSAVLRDAPPAFTSNQSATYLWFVDHDRNSGTGQSHGPVGSEFNVRVVLGSAGAVGFVDRTGSVPGGGSAAAEVDGNRIRIVVAKHQLGAPAAFNWNAGSFGSQAGSPQPGNPTTLMASSMAAPPPPLPATVELSPPLLTLHPGQAGQVRTILRRADGGLLDPTDYEPQYTLPATGVASVAADGAVQALRVPEAFGETPYLRARVDGVDAFHSTVVRVNRQALDIQPHRSYHGNEVSFYLPPQLEGLDLERMLLDNSILEATDAAYRSQRYLSAIHAFSGQRQHFVVEVGDDGPTLPCGLSGNPIRLGWHHGRVQHNTCFIINAPGDGRPQFFVYFHEIGHNITLPSRKFVDFAFAHSPGAVRYVEGLATMPALWAMDSIRQCGALAGRPAGMAAIDSIQTETEAVYRNRLASYVAQGARYDEADADVIDGIMLAIREEFGRNAWFRFSNVFLPAAEPLPCPIVGREQQASFFVAALSAATGIDLRQRFASTWGFPIDQAAWPNLLSCANTLVEQRAFSEAADCDETLGRGSAQTRLAVAKTGPGDGLIKSLPVGIDCGENCSASFQNGSQVVLTALPGAAPFAGWTGCDFVENRSCTVTLDRVRQVHARFEPEPEPLDEPSIQGFALPGPNPPNANCPAGFFIATVEDGPGPGLTPGVFGMELLLDAPGTRLLAGGLNFGGLVDVAQPGFAGFNFANPANEPQRLNLRVNGSPSSNAQGQLPVTIRIERRPDANSSVTVFETNANLSLAQAFTSSVELPPGFYAVTVSTSAGSAGGAPDGQFFFELATSFLDRPGGGFQGGAVVGGYHAEHPFGGVSGFAAFCIATPHATSMRALSAPTYGPTGARDLRLRLLDAQQRSLLVVPVQ